MSKDQESIQAAEGRPASQLIEADPHLVAFSLNNPRKRRGLDVESLSALASSIKTRGLAQPILVRPLPGNRTEDTFRDRAEGQPLPTYELVCGERRLRASRLAELDAIPMLVRELDDDAALELQLVENIEREDLDPLEEAEGFELLRTRLGYSAEQIAERIGKGKTKDYVYKTMKLLQLTPESRQALDDGHLGRSTGLLVARYPAEQQAQVMEFIKSLATKGEPGPYRLVAPQVFRRFNLVLTAAVWPIADADLVPAAGACTTCPKRTGAHGDLFADEADSPDSCTDPDCFESKRAAHIERVKAQAQRQGLKVIDGQEARQAIPSAYSHYIQGYTKLSDVAYVEKGADDVEREVTFEDVLRSQGKKAPKPRLIINPHTGEAIKVITDDLAEKLTPEQDEVKGKGRVGVDEDEEPDDRPADMQALDDYNVRRAVLRRVFDAIRSRDRTDGDMLLIAKALLVFQFADDGLESLESYLSWADDFAETADPGQLLRDKLDAMPATELAAVVTMGAAAIIFGNYSFHRLDELAVAAAYGVDVLAVRDKVAEDLDREDRAGAPAGDDDDDQDGDGELAATSTTTVEPEPEPEPTVGARVRMKDNLRTAGSKFRKISGREGMLLQELPQGDWMFRSDGGKDKARVSREEFTVLPSEPAPGDSQGDEGPPDEAGDGVETRDWPLPVAKKVKATLSPMAAWPFPKKAE